MLEPNRLDPPRPYREVLPSAAAQHPPRAGETLFVSPEDFDATGILAGFDPSASSYWWMPELHAAESSDPMSIPAIAAGTHATRRAASRPQAAA